MERNKTKKQIHIHRQTGSNVILAMLDKLKIESKTESDTENLLEDSDRKDIAEQPIPENKEERHHLLPREVAINVEGEVLDINEPPAQKFKKKVAELKRKRTSKFAKTKKCTLEANLLLDIPGNTNPLLISEGTTNLNWYDCTGIYNVTTWLINNCNIHIVRYLKK